MVLRKQPPPHLECTRHIGHFDPRPSKSPIAKSASQTSPKRLTRPRRAQSSPQPRHLPSQGPQDPVYSPSLHTSPAFDLMSLEQAQRSPVGTASSDPNPWADELVEKPDDRYQDKPLPERPLSEKHNHQEGTATDRHKGARVPSIVMAGTQRRMAANGFQQHEDVNDSSEWEHVKETPVQLQSNNPFLKTRQSENNPWQSESQGEEVRDSRATSLLGSELSQSEGYIPMTARLSLLDQAPSDSPWAEERPAPDLPPRKSFNDQSAQNWGQSYDPYGDSETAIHAQPDFEKSSTQNELLTPSATTSTPTTHSSHVLIDFDEHTKSEMEVSHGAPYAYGTDMSATHSNSEMAPPLPQRPTQTQDTSLRQSSEPFKAPMSEADASRQAEQRSETYTIRHVRWTDRTGKLRESPMLAQNENGPCPLLALVNALVLRADEDAQTPVIRALQEREQISLGLLIQALFEELITRLSPDDEFPDIEALSRFLTMLHTGMNVNPRLTLEQGDSAGDFYKTNDIRLYGTFGVPLIHGWFANPSTETHAAFMRVAQYHEDIQLLQFRKEELEDRVFRGGTLSFEEEQTMNDIQIIQQFVDVDNATQLSTFGLDHLKTQLAPGSVSIFFRNDHFSTLYKHPQSHKLYTLVTDAGYASHAEIVWECLVDVSGSNAEFFSGDFRPVGHGPSEGAPDFAAPQAPSCEANHSTTKRPSQEQSDADYAYALALQFQEEEQNNEARNRRQSAPSNGPSQNPANQRSSSTVRRSNTQYPHTDHRSRSQQSPSVGRMPEDGPPPSYEQAARGRFQASPHSRSATVAHTPPDVRHQRNNQNPYRRRSPAATFSALGIPERDRLSKEKDRNKDCVVM